MVENPVDAAHTAAATRKALRLQTPKRTEIPAPIATPYYNVKKFVEVSKRYSRSSSPGRFELSTVFGATALVVMEILNMRTKDSVSESLHLRNHRNIER